MKITPQCVPCLLRRAIYEAELSGPRKVPAAIRAACGVFARRYRPGVVSARLATEVHAAVYRALRDRDPYRDLRGAPWNYVACPPPDDRGCDVVPVADQILTDFLWQRSPFLLYGGGRGTIERAGIDFILPYWMARHYGVV